MQHDIAVITVVYNNYADFEEYFESLEKQSQKNFHVFIADASTHKQEIRAPKYTTVIDVDNKGYAHALNAGYDKAVELGYEKFVFMNNDTIVARDFIEKVEESLKRHPESLIGGKIFYAPGYEYHEGRYTKKDMGHVIWYGGGIIDWNNAWATHKGVDEVDTGKYDKEEATQFVTGCLMVFDKALIDKAGKMDDSYFMYFEDADWCEQVRAAGRPIIYDPSIVIWHKNAQSTGGSGSVLQQKFQRKNQLKFGLRYAPMRTKLHLLKNYYFAQAL